MSAADPPPAPDRRYAVWLGATAALLVAAIAAGFVWLPGVQAGRGGPDLWASICTAIGLPGREARPLPPPGSKPSSEVAWTAATQLSLARGNASRGAALAAASCNGCHGPAGVSDDAIFPNLAGQGAAAIYKQLQDFRSGMRDPAVMGVYVAGLSDDDVRDLAAHYASLPTPVAQRPAPALPADGSTRRLVEFGDPMRGIVACAACHGPAGHVAAAPPLQGQQRAYLEVQLQAFASGTRHNDISAQMRSVANGLTPLEIGALAAYYAAAPGDPTASGPATDGRK